MNIHILFQALLVTGIFSWSLSGQKGIVQKTLSLSAVMRLRTRGEKKESFNQPKGYKSRQLLRSVNEVPRGRG